jgi:UDP-GlcNAc:undecaprenyl-phosphate/decaprenyl-phosphate GlcNAc-1-phosphate transferase
VALIVAFALAVAATPIAAVVARRLGLVDAPGPLKVHADPVPYLGGVAVFAALAAPVAAERPLLLLPIGLALLLGLADDRGGVLSPVARLILESGIGVTAVVAIPVHGFVDSLVTVVLVVGMLNAINLLDGLDGLASGVSAVAAAGFAFVVEGGFQILALALAGSLLGFLVWNRPPARIYLGDAGSYLIGTALAMLLVVSLRDGDSLSGSSGAILFVAVPMADTAVAIVRRLRARRPLLQGDRGHVYDQLADKGWDRISVTAAFIGAQAALVAIGIAIGGLAAGLAISITAVVLLIVAAFFVVAFTTPGTWKAQ